jgi:two-component system sensor histidine kinase AgrC
MFLAVEIATVIVEIFFVSFYLKGLFQNYEKNRRYVLLTYFIAGIGLCALSIFPVNPFIRLGYTFLSITLLAKLHFQVKWLASVYSSLLLCMIYIIVDFVCSGIVGMFGVTAGELLVFGNSRIITIVMAKLVQVFCIFLVIKMTQWKKSHDSLVNAIPLLLCQVFSVFICYLMYLGGLENASVITPVFVIGSVGILYINVIIVFYVERIKEVSEIKKQNELAEQRYHSSLEYFQQVKDDQEETRALWHDIKKYLNTMTELINNNEITHAKECIHHVSELFRNTGNIVDVGNTVISAVLNHSVQKARRLNIETELDVWVPKEINISAADLSVMIGNTFDNAIEACEKLKNKEKKISIQLVQKESILFFEMKNPYEVSAPAEKKDRKIHGYGLKNVKRCVDKYKGIMQNGPKDGIYVVSIHINVPAAALSEKTA